MSEGERNLAQERAALQAAIAQTRKDYANLLGSAKTQRGYAAEQLERWKKEMEPLKAEGMANNKYATMHYLHQSYVSMQAMADIAIAAYEHNIKLLDAPGERRSWPMQNPEENGAYIEHKRRHRNAIGRYQLHYNIEGIDTVLRFGQEPRLITPKSTEEMAEREAMVKKLRTAALASKPMEQFLLKLAADLSAMRDFTTYGAEQFAAWERMSTDQRVAFLKDPGWEKYEGQLALLREIHQRCETYPAVAELFREWKQEKLPYSTRAVGAAGAGKTGPLAAKPGTDTLNFKQGRKSSFTLP